MSNACTAMPASSPSTKALAKSSAPSSPAIFSLASAPVFNSQISLGKETNRHLVRFQCQMFECVSRTFEASRLHVHSTLERPVNIRNRHQRQRCQQCQRKNLHHVQLEIVSAK